VSPGRRRPLAVGMGVVAVIAAAAVAVRLLMPGADDRYLAELTKNKVIKGFPSAAAAVEQGEAFCLGLKSGKPTSGYQWQFVAVRNFCPEFTNGFSVVPTPEELREKFYADLQAQNLAGDYTSMEAAVAAAQSFCAGLRNGKPAEGYKSQLVGVKYYCPQFADAFTVIPTPQEQEAVYTAKLRNAGLGGTYPSDAAAVAHAHAVCQALDAGGPQKGPQEDGIDVSVYCHKYSAGFQVLHPIKVDGPFELIDTSYYSSGIAAVNGRCQGQGPYSDIFTGQEVFVKNGDGKILTRTVLGRGDGNTMHCTFGFRFTVMDGEDDYVVSVSHRGDVHYTAAQLKIPGSVGVTLGD
jgi:Protein of unknown function (DUF732)